MSCCVLEHVSAARTEFLLRLKQTQAAFQPLVSEPIGRSVIVSSGLQAIKSQTLRALRTNVFESNLISCFRQLGSLLPGPTTWHTRKFQPCFDKKIAELQCLNIYLCHNRALHTYSTTKASKLSFIRQRELSPFGRHSIRYFYRHKTPQPKIQGF